MFACYYTLIAVVDFFKSGGKLGEVNQVAASLITMYGKCGQLDDAHAVFEHIPQNKLCTVVCTAMMSVFVQHGKVDKALQLFNRMKQLGLKPDEVTWTVLFTACAETKALDEGKKLHAGILFTSTDDYLPFDP